MIPRSKRACTAAIGGSVLAGAFSFGVPATTAQAAGNPISFNTTLTSPSVDAPDAMVAVDLNNNGIIDVVTTDSETGDEGLQTFFNDGAGNLTLGALYPVGTSEIHSDRFVQKLVTADFNGDGFADLALANYASDGGVSVLLNQGNGTFGTAAYYPTYKYPAGLAVGDLNADGHADIVAGNYYDKVSVLINGGDGTFGAAVDSETTTARNFSVATADLNGDGRDDVVASGVDMTGAVMLSNGNGTLNLVQDLATTQGDVSYSTLLVDVDGDGDKDIVRNENSYNRTYIAFNNGSGVFGTWVEAGERGDAYLGLDDGDLNGDGILDLSIGAYENSVVVVLAGNGDGTFESAIDIDATPAEGTYGVANVDMNGDGRTDIVTSASHTGKVIVLLNTTTYPTPTATSLSPSNGPLAGGNIVTVKGTNLTSAYQVLVNGVKAKFTVDASGNLRVTMPPGAKAGPVTIAVKTGGGEAAWTYTYDPDPTPSPKPKYPSAVTLDAGPVRGKGDAKRVKLTGTTRKKQRVVYIYRATTRNAPAKLIKVTRSKNHQFRVAKASLGGRNVAYFCARVGTKFSKTIRVPSKAARIAPYATRGDITRCR